MKRKCGEGNKSLMNTFMQEDILEQIKDIDHSQCIL
jgi:hypothetical protein